MASRVRSSGDYRIDAREFSELMNDVKAFDKDLGLRIRKNIRDAAKPIVKDMRKAVTAPQSKRSGRNKGTRIRTRTVKGIDFDGTEFKDKVQETVDTNHRTSELVAKGITFRVSTGNAGGAVRFVSSSRALPEQRKAMSRALNKKSFRHPVFGDTKHWVTQEGRPYFGSVILGNTAPLYDAIEKALDEAATALGRSRLRR